MKFSLIPVANAEGAILAHAEQAIGAPGETKPYLIQKGTRLEQAHIDALIRAGSHEVVAAQLEPGDVHEDAAAAALAAAILGADRGLRASGDSTGRVNLRATRAGIVQIDVDAIHAVNRVDPGITVATVPPWRKTGPRGLTATIKIIPYAVPGAALSRACDLAQGAMRLCPPVIASATLIETRVGQQKLSDKGRRAMKARMAHFGVDVTHRLIVPHEIEAIADAIATAPGELVMVLTGSATSDIHDTAPEALRHAGGAVLHYGMPVDPGNLLFLGKLATKWVVGLPGCARSPALNGADWVLERLICGVDVSADDIASMGVGGLLKDIPSRPVPRKKIEG